MRITGVLGRSPLGSFAFGKPLTSAVFPPEPAPAPVVGPLTLDMILGRPMDDVPPRGLLVERQYLEDAATRLVVVERQALEDAPALTMASTTARPMPEQAPARDVVPSNAGRMEKADSRTVSIRVQRMEKI